MAAPLGEFEDLCRAQYPRLVGALGLQTGDRELAEELAQETLARAWRQWTKVSRAQDPVAWLFVVGFNLAKSHGRRLGAEKRMRAKLPTPDAEHHPPPSDTSDLRLALASLPTRHRTVLVMRYYLGYTLPEIAEHLDVPLPTVKTWSARGLRRIRQDAALKLEEAPDVG